MTEAEAQATFRSIWAKEIRSVSADDAVKVYARCLEVAREHSHERGKTLTEWYMRQAAHAALRAGGMYRVDEIKHGKVPDDWKGRLRVWASLHGDGITMAWQPYPIPGVSFSHRFEWLPKS